MAQKLIDVDGNLLIDIRIAREMEARRGRKMTLNSFYEQILQAGLDIHKKNVARLKKCDG